MAATAWPKLPARAAYLTLNNPTRRNALSLSVLRDLRTQLISYNTSPRTGKLLILPPFQSSLLPELESAFSSASSEYGWLANSTYWATERHGLPSVLVLRSSGPVFSAGHDLGELHSLTNEEVKETFALCAEVMSLIRRSPIPVVGVIQGLATAAGAQLAMTTDLPIAAKGTQFRLPGASLGLPCTSPSTAVSRRLGPSMTYRMLALAELVKAEELNGAVEVVDGGKFEERISEVVNQLAEKTAAQPQGLGKWAFWTQYGLKGNGDGYEEAVEWTGRVMALHAKSEDAREGMRAFLGKRKAEWKL